jgi:hypothetical protein
MVEVITNAGLNEQIVLLEYCPPSQDDLPYRIDMVICGTDQRNVLNFVFIELKQWTNVKKSDPGFLFIKRGKEWERKTHPRTQVEMYRHYMVHVLDTCKISRNIVKISAYAYLHNIKLASAEEKSALYDKGHHNEEDTRLYTHDYAQALSNKIKEHVGQGAGERVIYILEDIRARAARNFTHLPTSKVPMPKGFRTAKSQFRHEQLFVGALLLISVCILASGILIIILPQYL